MVSGLLGRENFLVLTALPLGSCPQLVEEKLCLELFIFFYESLASGSEILGVNITFLPIIAGVRCVWGSGRTGIL